MTQMMLPQPVYARWADLVHSKFFFSPKFTRDFNRAFRLPKEFMLKFSIFFFSQVNEIGPTGVHGDVVLSDSKRGGILHHALLSGVSTTMISTIIAADLRCVR